MMTPESLEGRANVFYRKPIRLGSLVEQKKDLPRKNKKSS